MNNYIVSIGTSNPGEAIPQLQIARFMKMAHELEDDEGRKLNFIYKQSGIEQRFSVIEDFKHEDPSQFTFFPNNKLLEPFPTTEERMNKYKAEALTLAIKAVENCLSASETAPTNITHLIVISCTGMYAPGLEIDLLNSLQMNNEVERYAIQFMGCYAAFSGLKMASRICDSDPKANVLVVAVELCTLHFQKKYDEDTLLSNALFGDGAAAALIKPNGGGLKIKDFYSQLFTEGENDMAWAIGDFGFEMKLSKYVPELLKNGLGTIIENLEKRYQLSDIKNYAIHPGGKQILQKLEEVFGIARKDNEFSYDVLSKYGNMSSVTILFVLKKWMDQAEKAGPILAMGFGPGLTLETLLLEK
jgi:predicted naringenin-chalcone synthase